jgi:hypothetical protein
MKQVYLDLAYFLIVTVGAAVAYRGDWNILALFLAWGSGAMLVFALSDLRDHARLIAGGPPQFGRRN